MLMTRQRLGRVAVVHRSWRTGGTASSIVREVLRELHLNVSTRG
jgi:hypothetical protein